MKAYRVWPKPTLLTNDVDLVFAKNTQQAELLIKENMGLCNTFGPRKYELWPGFSALPDRHDFVIKRESNYDGMENVEKETLILLLIKIGGWEMHNRGILINKDNIEIPRLKKFYIEHISDPLTFFQYDNSLRLRKWVLNESI